VLRLSPTQHTTHSVACSWRTHSKKINWIKIYAYKRHIKLISQLLIYVCIYNLHSTCWACQRAIETTAQIIHKYLIDVAQWMLWMSVWHDNGHNWLPYWLRQFLPPVTPHCKLKTQILTEQLLKLILQYSDNIGDWTEPNDLPHSQVMQQRGMWNVLPMDSVSALRFRDLIRIWEGVMLNGNTLRLTSPFSEGSFTSPIESSTHYKS